MKREVLEMSKDLANKKVTSPYAKFLIGALAGFSVVTIPRLSSSLISGEEAGFDYFPMNYIMAIVTFAVLLGLLVMVMEYKLPKPPKETFFAALAIPGLIVGSLNSVVDNAESNSAYKNTIELTKELQIRSGLETESIESLEFIQIGMITPNPQEVASTIDFSFIRTAHAKDQSPKLNKHSNSMGFSVQRADQKFAISIGNYTDKNEAIAEAKKIIQKKPDVTLVRTTRGYELLLNSNLLTETQATIEALKVKRELNITPKLLKFK